MVTQNEIELLQQIDAQAERFEAEIKANRQTDLSSYLEPFDGEARSACFESLFAIDFDYQTRNGASPNREQLLKQFPEFSEIINQVFALAESQRPQRIGPYELREKLGEGGMGAVYKAWHSRLRRYVAIKLLPPETADNPELLARFDREMQAVGKLSHPNVVTASDADCRDGVHFLAMEYCDGMDVGQVIKLLGPIEVADACEIICQAADGLQHAHEHGLVHRDIKPSNLMLSRDGTVRVLDMGLARLSANDQRELTTTGQIMGTFDYMAPEQASGSAEIDIRSDVYSLGTTLFKLLTGTVPFTEPKYDTTIKKLIARTTTPADSIATHRDDLPQGVIDATDRMLQTSPELRFDQPKDIRSALEVFCDGSGLVELIATATQVSPLAPPEKHDPEASTIAKSPAAEIDTVSQHSTDLSFESKPQLEVTAVSTQQAAKTSKTVPDAVKPEPLASTDSQSKPPWAIAAIASLLFFGFVGLYAAGVFSFKTPNGTLEIKSKGDTFTTTMKGKTVSIKNTATDETYNIDLDSQQETRQLEPGKYVVLTSESGLAVHTDHFTLKSGKTESIEVTWVPNKEVPNKETVPPAITSDAAPVVGDPKSEREIAEWILQQRGKVVVRSGPRTFKCSEKVDLPEEEFQVIEAGLPPTILDDQFERVARLKSLEKLELSLKVKGPGLAHFVDSNLKDLSCSVGKLSPSQTQAKVKWVAKLTNLERLRLTHGALSGELGLLAPLTKLNYLYVGWSSNLVAEDLDDLSVLPQLEELQWRGEIDAAALKRMLKNLPNLKMIDRTPIPVFKARLAEREIAKTLIEKGGSVTFRTNGEPIECWQASEIPVSPEFPIFAVDLGRVQSGLTANDLAPLSKIAALRSLTIRPNFDLNTMRQVAKLPLRILYLADMNAKPEVIDQITTMKTLQYLGFLGPIKKEQLRRLHPLAPRLRGLLFGDGSIRDDDLAEIAKFNHLTKLEFGANPNLTDAAIDHILPMQSLRELFLINTGVTDTGITQLSQMQNLQEVLIIGNQCTTGGIEKLRDALPKCKIVYEPRTDVKN